LKLTWGDDAKFIRYWLEGFYNGSANGGCRQENVNLKLGGGVWMAFSLGRLSKAWGL
jgi:hypothetical protein